MKYEISQELLPIYFERTPNEDFQYHFVACGENLYKLMRDARLRVSSRDGILIKEESITFDFKDEDWPWALEADCLKIMECTIRDTMEDFDEYRRKEQRKLQDYRKRAIVG